MKKQKELNEYTKRILKALGYYFMDGKEHHVCPLCGIDVVKLDQCLSEEFEKGVIKGREETKHIKEHRKFLRLSRGQDKEDKEDKELKRIIEEIEDIFYECEEWHETWDGENESAWTTTDLDCAKEKLVALIELEKKRGVLEYILSLGWQDTDNKYVKEVIEDADRISKLLKEENEKK